MFFVRGLTIVILGLAALPLLAAAPHAQVPDDAPLWSMQSLIALLTLTGLEVVLGIDNVIFIAILSGKLPKEQRGTAQKTGIALAVLTRIALLFTISLMMGLTRPLFPGAIWPFDVLSGKSLILIGGGLFLIGKAAYELHEKLEAVEHTPGAGRTARAAASFGMVIFQIVLIDIVFSLDSVITAVGMSNQIVVMVTAVMIAAGVMIAFARPISSFVENHPTLKVLALAFLILIGVMLFVEGFGHHVPKGYIYFAMFFALCVEMFNLRLRKKAEKIRLHYSTMPSEAQGGPPESAA